MYHLNLIYLRNLLSKLDRCLWDQLESNALIERNQFSGDWYVCKVMSVMFTWMHTG